MPPRGAGTAALRTVQHSEAPHGQTNSAIYNGWSHELAAGQRETARTRAHRRGTVGCPVVLVLSGLFPHVATQSARNSHGSRALNDIVHSDDFADHDSAARA